MPLKLNSTGGGSVSLDAPSTASTFTLTLPAANATVATTTGTLTNPTINGFTGDTSVINVGSGQFYKDTSGNVGIGTTSPTQRLETSGGLRIGAATLTPAFSGGIFSYDTPVTRAFVGDGTGYSWRFSSRASSTTTDLVFIQDNASVGIATTPSTKLHVKGANEPLRLQSDTVSSAMYQTIYNSAGSRRMYQGYAGASTSDYSLWNEESGAILFGTNSIERARITSTGDLFAGTATANPSWASRVTLSTDGGTTRWAVGPYGTATNFIISASASGGVYLNGTAATSWTAVSDERWKTDFFPINDALPKVCSLRAITGVYKDDEAKTRKPFLIAQDVLSVFPEAVDTSNPDRYGLSYTDMIPLLVASIKELKSALDAANTRIAQLEAK